MFGRIVPIVVFTASVLAGLPPLLAPALQITSQAPTRNIKSPVVNPDHSVTFLLSAPHAANVTLRLEAFPGLLPLKKDDEGVWRVTTPPVDPGVYHYHLIVDGLSTVDPANSYIAPSYVLANVLEVREHNPFIYDLRADVPHGTIRLETFESKLLKKTVQYYVYTPPGYEESGKNYPVLYDLHGAPGFPGIWGSINDSQRTIDNLLAEKKAPEMILVVPTAEISPFFPFPRQRQLTPAEIGTGLQAFEDYFLGEFIPYFETQYRVKREPRTRWLTGYSLGGIEAFHVGVRHPDMFSIVRAGAPIGRIWPFERPLETQYPQLSDAKVVNRSLRLLYLDWGASDDAQHLQERFHSDLQRLGVKHEFVIWGAGGGTHVGSGARFAFASFIERLDTTVMDGTAAAPSGNVSDPELAKAIQERNRAEHTRDLNTFSRMTADDFTLTRQTGKIVTKSQRIEELRTGPISPEPPPTTEDTIRTYNGDTALRTRRVIRDGKPVRMLTIWVKQNQQWKVAATQVTAERTGDAATHDCIASTSSPDKAGSGRLSKENPWLGTWVLSVEESKRLDPNGTDLAKSVIVIQTLGEQIKIIDDDTPPRGKPTHFEWVGKFDGKDYPASGDAFGSTWSYEPIDEYTQLLIVKKDGRIRTTRQLKLSPDGKTRTVYGTRGNGTQVTAVYEKQ